MIVTRSQLTGLITIIIIVFGCRLSPDHPPHVEQIKSLMKPFRGELVAHPVSNKVRLSMRFWNLRHQSSHVVLIKVGNVRCDGAELIQPIDPSKPKSGPMDKFVKKVAKRPVDESENSEAPKKVQKLK